LVPEEPFMDRAEAAVDMWVFTDATSDKMTKITDIQPRGELSYT
jgi:hypothetical protein